MSITVADLQIKAEGNTRDAEQSIDRLNGKIGQTPGFLSNATSTAAGFIIAQGVMRAVGEAVNFAADSIIGFNSKLEQAQIGFTTMLGSGEKAKEFLDGLEKFAAQTPFRFEGLVTSSQRLLAMGFAADEIIPTLTAVGDAVAALGAGDEGINRATYALGQMRAAGKVTAQDMMQLTSLGIPAWGILADKIGVSTAEVRKLAEKGLITADTAMQALTEGMEERFGGLMAAQTQTFSGAMSTIADVGQSVIAKAFKPMFDIISDIAVGLAAFLQSEGFVKWANDFQASLGGVISTLTEATGKVFDFFGGLAEAAGGGFVGTDFVPMLTDVVNSVVDWGADMLAEFNRITMEVLNTIVQLVIDMGPELIKAGLALADWVIEAAPKLFENLLTMRGDMVEWALGVAPKLRDAVLGWGESILSWIGDAGPKMGEALAKMLDSLITFLEGQVPALIGFVQEWISSMVAWLTTDGLAAFLDALGGLVDGAVAFIGDGSNIERLVSNLVAWTGGFLTWIVTDLIPQVVGALPGVITAIGGFIIENAPKVLGLLLTLGIAIASGIWEGFKSIPVIGNIIGFVEEVVGIIGGLPDKVIAFFTDLATSIGEWWDSLGDSAGEKVGHLIGIIIGGIVSLPGRVIAFFQDLAGKVAAWFTTTTASAGTNAEGLVKKILAFIGTLPARAITAIGELAPKLMVFFSELPGKIWNNILYVGKRIVQGIWQGIQNMVGWLGDQISGFVDGIVDGIAEGLGISSPSKVMMGFGEQMVRGLAKGILENGRVAEKALSDTLGGLTDMAAPAMEALMGTAAMAFNPVLAGGAAPTDAAGLAGVTIIINAERFVGTEDEARYYADLIATDMRLRMPN